jgi:hypothetical protein
MKEGLTYLHSDDALEISFAPGSGKNAVVSFAGVGLSFGGIQKEEFAKSLETSTSDAYYVKDKLRHWYFECADKVTETVNRSLLARNTKSTTCIGNSMGGFGAIYFAPHLLNCRTAAAFVPQSSVNTAIVPWEKRWMEWRASLAPGNGLDAARSLDPKVSYSVFIGLHNRFDTLHVRRLLKQSPDSFTAYGLPDSGHDAATHLKRLGVLKPLLLALRSGNNPEPAAALRDCPHEILTFQNIERFLKTAGRKRE